MSMLYLAQANQQQQLDWLDGGTIAILVDGAATDGQLMMGRFDVSEGEAPPYHQHTREDEVFMLIKGTALVWYDDQEHEVGEGGVVFLPKGVPHGYRITSKKADLGRGSRAVRQHHPRPTALSHPVRSRSKSFISNGPG